MGLPYPTVYVRSRSGYVESLSYDVKKHRWIRIIRPLTSTSKGKSLKLYFIGQTLSIPFWMGPMKGPYIVHGAYSRVKGVDIWGGF